jgi:uncharacterized protein (TIGR02147 family)
VYCIFANYVIFEYNLDMNSKPSIFEYDDYRKYLKDLFKWLKLQDKKFSLRYFAKTAGYKTHSFLKEVIDGKSNLSSESIQKFATTFKLNIQETEFFKNLVCLNQSRSTEEKQIYAREIVRSHAYRKVHPLKESQLRYCTQWYYVVVREMINLPNFKEDPEWIAANTMPVITSKQAQEALDELLKLGLISRNEKGALTQTNPIIASADEVASSMVAQFHREFMKKASEAIDLVPRENRDISSVTFRVSTQTAKRIKEKIQNFRRELMEEASRDQEPEAIFQLNLQMFPVTQFGGNKKGGGQ